MASPGDPNLTSAGVGQSQTVLPLPDSMPKAWVEQITNAMPQVWPTLLGSAVLAAFIGWASSYFTARMTINANLDLEKTKIKLQMDQEKTRTRSAAYNDLATALETLHNTFSSYIVFVKYLSTNQSADKKDSKALAAQLAEVGKAEAKVATAAENVNLAPNALKPDIDSCLGELVPTLLAAAKEPKSVLAHESIDNKLTELASLAHQQAFSQ